MATLRVAFWNLQNLFDITASEIATDLEFTPAHGWDQAAFDAKVAHLAEVIGLMHGEAGVDLLGICEIENRSVAETLIAATGRADLRLAHSDAPDIRGIDTALIYSDTVFELIAPPIAHSVAVRFPTRDIFQVRLRVRATGAELTVFVNHWPSRRQGVYESEPHRITVAELCGRLVDDEVKFSRKDYEALPDAPGTFQSIHARFNRNVLVMGDLNDEPSSRSILDYLRAARDLDRIEEDLRKPAASEKIATADYLKRKVFLFNCMWRLVGQPDLGSHFFGDATNTMNMLDQFIVSRGLLFGAQGLRLVRDSVRILQPAVMTTAKGRPIAFDKAEHTGYSDHFPIEIEIETV